MITNKTIKKLSKEFPSHKFELVALEESKKQIKVDGTPLNWSFNEKGLREFEEIHELNAEEELYTSILVEVCHLIGKQKKTV